MDVVGNTVDVVETKNVDHFDDILFQKDFQVVFDDFDIDLAQIFDLFDIVLSIYEIDDILQIIITFEVVFDFVEIDQRQWHFVFFDFMQIRFLVYFCQLQVQVIIRVIF